MIKAGLKILLGISASIGAGLLIGVIMMNMPFNSDKFVMPLYFILSYGSSFLVGVAFAPPAWINAIGLTIGQLAYVLNQDKTYQDSLWAVTVVILAIIGLSTIITAALGNWLHRKKILKKQGQVTKQDKY